MARVQFLGWEDPLQEGTAAHSSILAWRISWTEEPGGQQSMGSQRVRDGEEEPLSLSSSQGHGLSIESWSPHP